MGGVWGRGGALGTAGGLWGHWGGFGDNQAARERPHGALTVPPPLALQRPKRARRGEPRARAGVLPPPRPQGVPYPLGVPLSPPPGTPQPLGVPAPLLSSARRRRNLSTATVSASPWGHRGPPQVPLQMGGGHGSVPAVSPQDVVYAAVIVTEQGGGECRGRGHRVSRGGDTRGGGQKQVPPPPVPRPMSPNRDSVVAPQVAPRPPVPPRSPPSPTRCCRGPTVPAPPGGCAGSPATATRTSPAPDTPKTTPPPYDTPQIHK